MNSKDLTNAQIAEKIAKAENMSPRIRRLTGLTNDRVQLLVDEMQRRMIAGTWNQ